MNSKQRNEQRIFNIVYSNRNRLNFTHGDKPDFLVSLVDGLNFGVEITEFFQNESQARLNNIPNYISDLLDGKPMRHKDDKENIIVDEIILINEYEIEIPAQAIIQKDLYALGNTIKICALIKEKNDKISGYKSNLNHINLVIYNSSHCYQNIDVIDFYNYFYKDEMVSSLLNSNFREIYFISSFNNNNNYTIPLKRTLFLSEIYFFQEVLIKSEITELSEITYYQILAAFLNFRVFKNIYIVSNLIRNELLFGNTGFTLKNEKEVVLIDYGDSIISTDFQPISKYHDFINNKIMGIIKEIEKSFYFQTNLGAIVEPASNDR